MALERLGGACAVCGTSEGLEFDHVEPATFYASPLALILAPLDVFMAEVDKCQLLCHTHHKQKTRKSNGWHRVGSLEGRPHGTKTTYNEGCRCAECTAGNRLRMRAYLGIKGRG